MLKSEQARLDLAESKLAEFTPEEKLILGTIWLHGKVDGSFLERSGAEQKDIDGVIRKGFEQHLLEGNAAAITINPRFQDALRLILFDGEKAPAEDFTDHQFREPEA